MRRIRFFDKKMLLIGLLFIGLWFFIGCEKEPIKIGFIGSLTSKNSQLSIDARNAISLGIDQVNANGGIDGRKLELVVKDDGADPEVALEKHTEFMNEGVHLILGHTTSNMAEVVLKSQSEDLLFLSPSMSASSLKEKDDYFIRTAPQTDHQAFTFFDLMDKLSLNKAVIVYDLMNAEYTENLAEYAQALSKDRNDYELTLIPFDSRSDDLKLVSEKVLDNENTEMVWMISQAIDTAVLSQLLKNKNPNLTLSSVSWSMTEDLFLNGGKAVEGMYFIGLNKAEFPSEAYISFKKDFENKYQYEPTFISVLTYDAFHVMVDALRQADSDSPKAVKQVILEGGSIDGLEETFEIDDYGDCNRKYLIYQIINDEFVPLFD